MGLDSYLYRVTYESGYRKSDRYRQLLEIVQAQDVAYKEGAIIVRVTVAYWRKANQIHKWFVDHCQGGVDDCRHADVSWKEVAELRDLCQALLLTKDNDKASYALPPEAGFFFGSTDLDENYWFDIKDTVQQLNRVLDHTPEDWDGWFEYHSSW